MFSRISERRILFIGLLVLIITCIPTFLVISVRLTGKLIPTLLIGLVLFFLFFRKNHHGKNQKNF